MDERAQQLHQWSEEHLKALGKEGHEWRLESVSGDASFRRYFRVVMDSLDSPSFNSLTSDQRRETFIAVDAPPDKEDNPSFVRIAQHWLAHKINVPEVLAFDFDHGFMLLSDFGNDLLLDTLTRTPEMPPAEFKRRYQQALEVALTIQQVPAEQLPAYDRSLLHNEMHLFSDWLLKTHLKLEMSTQETQELLKLYDVLAESACEQPQVTVHRDYHSRNIMVLDEGYGIIDFQDAVLGPITYDPVSLLRDCYIALPKDDIEYLLQGYFSQAKEKNAMPESMDYAAFRKAFDWMGMQRHLKASGIFARLFHRDSKDGYLPDIPLVLSYLLDVSGQYVEQSEEMKRFNDFLQKRVLPEWQRAHPELTMPYFEQVEV